MRYNPWLYVCILFIATLTIGKTAPLYDSVGVDISDDKTWVLHRVESQETLYSISKKYNVKVEKIIAQNPDAKTAIKIGQLLKIPIAKQKNQTTTSSSKNKHVVQSKQTLFSIAKMYGITVNQLKEWNNLTSDEILVGQELVISLSELGPKLHKLPSVNHQDSLTYKKNYKVDDKNNKIHKVQAGQTLSGLSRLYGESVENIMRWNQLTSPEIYVDQDLIVHKAQDNVEPIQEHYLIDLNKKDTTRLVDKTPIVKSTGAKIAEVGLAEAIDGTEDNPKYLALHKTAAPGTIVQVKNEINNVYIFARVVGKLPDTGANEKTIIRLTKKAYQKLGTIDKKTPVEVTYIQ